MLSLIPLGLPTFSGDLISRLHPEDNDQYCFAFLDEICHGEVNLAFRFFAASCRTTVRIKSELLSGTKGFQTMCHLRSFFSEWNLVFICPSEKAHTAPDQESVKVNTPQPKVSCQYSFNISYQSAKWTAELSLPIWLLCPENVFVPYMPS